MLDTLKSAKDDRYWLLGLTAGLVLFHLFLTDKTGDMKSFSVSFIFWGAVLSMVWDKKEQLRLRSDRFSSLLGTTLIALACWKIIHISSGGAFVQALPLIFGLSLALIASGYRGLGQYRPELLALGVLALPGEKFLSNILQSLIHALSGNYLAELTAQFTTVGLRLVGLPAELHDSVYVHTSKAIVFVHEGCSGGGVIDFLLRLSLLLMIVFPLQRLGKILSPLIAIAIGFLTNGVRVMVMVFLVHQGNTPAFDYWHTGNGSQIFGAIGVVLFGLACFPFIQPGASTTDAPPEAPLIPEESALESSPPEAPAAGISSPEVSVPETSASEESNSQEQENA
ncbi:MAG: cyanoexosortase A [Cyanobacteria bacterium P01_G01_bin.54]